MIKLLCTREGFATNSSSRHDIIRITGETPLDCSGYSYTFVEDEEGFRDTASGVTFEPDFLKDYRFGWGNWTASSVSTKAVYMALTLYYNLPEAIRDDVVLAWTGVRIPPSDKWGNRDGWYIDHQSIIELPVQRGTNLPNKTFFLELFNAVVNDPKVVIVGGSDQDPDHPLLEQPHSPTNVRDLRLDPLEPHNRQWARKDGAWWTLYDRRTGQRGRWAFEPVDLPKWSPVPDLVDLTITDYCERGCSYCYRNSSPAGMHADTNEIETLLWSFQEAGVFEVAIGGGEPTEHPDFANILRMARRRFNIVPNFSTRSIAWITSDKRDSYHWTIRESVMANCGAVAFSADRWDAAKLFLDKWRLRLGPQKLDGTLGPVPYIHHVVGSASPNEFARILLGFDKLADKYDGFGSSTLVLLGYKPFGRGAGGAPHEVPWLQILAEFKKKHWLRVAIDTALLDQVTDEQMEAAGFTSTAYDRGEGNFSCYFNAVDRTMARSSYTGGLVSYLNSNGHLRKDWLDVYRGWGRE